MCILEDFFRSELQEILVKQEISLHKICKNANLNQSVLTRYFDGKDIQISTFLKIIQSLPPESRSEFFWKINNAALLNNC